MSFPLPRPIRRTHRPAAPRRRLATTVVAAAALVLVPAAADVATAAPGDEIPVITVTTDPAPPEVGTAFWIEFHVAAGGVAVPDDSVAILWAGSSYPYDLVDGMTGFNVLVGIPYVLTTGLLYPGAPGIAPAAMGWSYDFADGLEAQGVTLAGLPASAVQSDTLPFVASATSGATPVVTTSGPCSVSAATIVPSGVGDCVVTAAVAGDATYAPATVSWTIEVTSGLTAQTITFDPAPPTDVTFGDAAVPVAASSDSGLDVALGVSGPCALDAGSLSFTGAGTCTVTASQAGDATYEAAEVTATVTIAKAPTVTTITLGSVAPTRTDFSVDVTAGGVSLNTGTLSFKLEGNTSPGWPTPFTGWYSGGSGYRTYTLTATYSGTADYLPSTATVVVDTRLSQTIGLDAALPDSAPVLSTLPLPETTSEGLPVDYQTTTPSVCTVTGTTLSLLAVGTCSVEGSNAGDATRQPVVEDVSFTVALRPQTITIAGAPATFDGGGQFTVSVTTDGPGPVTVTATGACTTAGASIALITVAGVGTCTITASGAGDAVTEPGTASVQVQVSAGSPGLALDFGGKVGQAAKGTSVEGSGTDLRPGEGLTLAVYSTPTVIGTTLFEPDGFTEVFGSLPALAAGTHRVVLTGTALDGTALEESLSFGVGADGTIIWIGQPGAMAATGTDAEGAATLAALAVLTGLGLVALRRRIAGVLVPGR